MSIRDQILRDEGLELFGYKDSLGKWTIGAGHCIETRPISRRAALMIFEDDLGDTLDDVYDALPWAANLNEPRRAVLVNMAFNLGIGGLLGFKKMLAACYRGAFDIAADEMLDSKWAEQVGARATRLAEQMRTGEWR